MGVFGLSVFYLLTYNLSEGHHPLPYSKQPTVTTLYQCIEGTL